MNEHDKISNLYGHEILYNYVEDMKDLSKNNNLKFINYNNISDKNKSRITLLNNLLSEIIKDEEIYSIQKMKIWSPCVMKKKGFVNKYI